MNKFTENFDSHVCVGDSITIEINGFTITARIEYDFCTLIDNDDVHNVDQSVTGVSDENYNKLMENREAWLNDEWFYCGVVLSVSKNGIELDDHAAGLWGIEANYPGGDNSYLTEVANELLEEAVEAGRQVLSELCNDTYNEVM